MWKLEQSLFDRGVNIVAGVDEAGRGPLAGPVVAGAVIVPAGREFSAKINDSKKLSAAQRRKAFREITETCCFAYAVIDREYIDKENILNAALAAMQEAVAKLERVPQYILVDGGIAPEFGGIQAEPVIGGDAKSISIACASIVAKVVRDNIMIDYDKQYPQYGFAAHKGYGTAEHRKAIEKFGPCEIHRRSFEPIKTIVSSLSLILILPF